MTETVAHRPAWRRPWTVGGCAAALVLGAGWGVHWWTVGRFVIETDNAYVRADVVTIAPCVAGTIVAVPVADNQTVRGGDVLARIDDCGSACKRGSDSNSVQSRSCWRHNSSFE